MKQIINGGENRIYDQKQAYRKTAEVQRVIRRQCVVQERGPAGDRGQAIFVRTVRKHYSGVIAFIDSRLTNAVAEGLNRIVKIIKNRASGFRILDAFTDMIFLAIGDVDIPARIPTHFRTL